MGRNDDVLIVADMRCHRIHHRLVAVGREGKHQYVVVPYEPLRVVCQARAERRIDGSVRNQLRTTGKRCGAVAGW